MATKFIQNSRERRIRLASDSVKFTNTIDDGRQKSAGLQHDQRLLEPGARTSPKHGPKFVKFEPKFAGTRLDKLDTGTLAIAAKQQQQPKSRHHSRRAGTTAGPRSATAHANAATAANSPDTKPKLAGADTKQLATTSATADEQPPAATATAAAANGQPATAHPAGTRPRARPAAARPANVPAAATFAKRANGR